MILSAHIGLTYKCNMKCKHCFVEKQGNQMELKNPMNLLKQLKDAGILILIYTYGENLLCKDFYEFATLAKREGFIQVLMSNGWYIQDNAIAEKLEKIGINKICISLDSIKSNIHDENRGLEGAWQRVDKCLGILSKCNMFFGIACTLNEENIEEVDQIVDYAIDKKVNFISFLVKRENGQISNVVDNTFYRNKMRDLMTSKKLAIGSIELYLHDFTLIPIIKELYKLEKITLTQYEKFMDMNRCHAFKDSLSINPNGDVSGCNFRYQHIANINDCELVEVLKVKVLDDTEYQCKRKDDKYNECLIN